MRGKFLGANVLNMLIQLFGERLSYKRGKGYATMSQVVMGDGSFYGFWLNVGVSASWKETAQTRVFVYSFFLVPCCWITLNLNQAKPNSYYPWCHVRFYTSVGQPLSKQLYSPSTHFKHAFVMHCVDSLSVGFSTFRILSPDSWSLLWNPVDFCPDKRCLLTAVK